MDAHNHIDILLRFRPISNSWVAVHPRPRGVVQFVGGAFFGESMFSRVSDASKVALAYMVDRVRNAGFALFDTQFITDHLASLGAVEISREDYHRKLARALRLPGDFDLPGPLPGPQMLVQRMTQTS